MLMVISPAKTLDFTPAPQDLPTSRPEFARDTAELSEITRALTPADLRGLMSISDKLADLNHARFQAFAPKGTKADVPAVLAFDGDVYHGLDARSLDAAALEWAQGRLRILSGLYGLLRPLDRIQPYRLEMGVHLRTPRGATLYDFWGDRVSKALNAAGKGQADPTLVNLASQEYFGAVDARALKLPVVNIHFKEEQNGALRTLAFYAKKARGLMARYAIEKRAERAEDLKGFDVAGYAFRPEGSTGADWLFARPHP